MTDSNRLNRIAHISIHGYVDADPQLGQTDTGGQVGYVLNLAKALARQGIRIDLFTRWFDKSKSQLEFISKENKTRLIRIPAGGWKFIPKESIYSILPELTHNLVKYIRSENLNYDLIHGHYVDAGIVAVDCASKLDIPAFFTSHSLGSWKRDQMGGDSKSMEKQYNFKHRITEEKRIFDSVTGQTVTSKVQQEKLFELYNLVKTNVEIIPPGVDVDHFKPDRSSLNATLSAYQAIFCLSRLDTNKGHDLLLNAFAEILEIVPDARLFIGGGSNDPSEREKVIINSIQSITEKHKMTDHVRLLGYVSDVDLLEYYRGASIFVLPSLFEPFGMTVLEAMACGMSVVASKFGGIRNVITDGKNGLLVDPTDAREFGSALVCLLRNTGLRKSIGQNARETMINSYSWDAIAKRHLEFYRSYL
jgi:mannosylfructose-phosphate synthase